MTTAKRDLKVVHSFKCGQDVPEWLLAVDPKSPHAKQGRVTFAADCDLYRNHFIYWLLPTDPLNMTFMFNVDGTKDCGLSAGSFGFSYPSRLVTIHGDGGPELIDSIDRDL